MFYSLQAFILFLSILNLSLPSTGFSESVNSKVQQGISHYHEGEFKKSVESFSSAGIDRPEDSRITYNLGNAHYRKGKFQEALQSYNQSALDQKNPDIQKNSIYNTGNSLVKLEKLEEAASAYKKVLTLDPSDMNAKYNLEYVRQKLKEKEKQKQESGKNQQKDKDNNSSQDKGENQSNNEGQSTENQPPSPDNTEPKNKNSENKNQDSSDLSEKPSLEANISKEEAEKILQGLTEDLKDISRMQAGKTKTVYEGNDW